MQNFSDEHVPVIEGAITVPTRGDAEAFVDAADIAAVAVETLVDVGAHAGAQYAPTGLRSLTVSEVADIIADVIGGPVTHNDIDADAWIGGAIAAGLVPADYAVMLRWLTGTRPSLQRDRMARTVTINSSESVHRENVGPCGACC